MDPILLLVIVSPGILTLEDSIEDKEGSNYASEQIANLDNTTIY